MVVDRLTDYQIAFAFGDTLSLIYKEKMQELNEELEPIYAHLDKLDIPRYSDFDKWFARATLPSWAKEKLDSIEHIQKIRRMWRKMKTYPERDGMDVERAKAVPMSAIFTPAKRMGKNVSCPFHPDNSPSMKLNANGTAKCFSCGWFGDGLNMFMDLNKVSFREAVLELGKM